eukprot:71643_1
MDLCKHITLLYLSHKYWTTIQFINNYFHLSLKSLSLNIMTTTTTELIVETETVDSLERQALKTASIENIPPPQEDTPLSKAERDAERAFTPRKHGCCGKKMWNYYLCGIDEKDGGAKTGSCCDADHLSMHLFFLMFIGSFFVLISGYNEPSDDGDIPSDTYYFIGMGWGLAVCLWGFWQLGRILGRRMQAAKIMDETTQLKKQSGNLQTNIHNAQDKRAKLAATHKITKDTTDQLKKKFNNIKKWTDQSKLISDQNSKIGAVLNDKLWKLMDDIQAELIESEKQVVISLYNQIQMSDGEKGLSRQEFAVFIKKLPDAYKQKFKFEVGSFDEYAGNDGVLDRNELFEILDKISEVEATKENEGNET